MRKNFINIYIKYLRLRLQAYLKYPHEGINKIIATAVGWIYNFITLLKLTIREFTQDDAFRHGAALSYYTIFSLPPILVILISGLGFFLGEEDIQGQLMLHIEDLFGKEGRKQLISVIEHFRENQDSTLSALVGFGTLIFTSTAVFYTLQNSLNLFWKVKPEQANVGFKTIVVDRLISFAMIVSLGALQLLSIIAEFLLAAFERLVSSYFPDYEVITNIFLLSNKAISLAVTAILFAVIFKYLPRAHVHWKDVWVGAIFTVCLFLIGKQLIGWYIQNMQPGLTYGAAGSIIVILLWVFYSSQILFLGAEFTYVYSKKHGKEILARKLYKQKKRKKKLQSQVE